MLPNTFFEKQDQNHNRGCQASWSNIKESKLQSAVHNQHNTIMEISIRSTIRVSKKPTICSIVLRLQKANHMQHSFTIAIDTSCYRRPHMFWCWKWSPCTPSKICLSKFTKCCSSSKSRTQQLQRNHKRLNRKCNNAK